MDQLKPVDTEQEFFGVDLRSNETFQTVGT
jgi:hypothetical protein